MDINLNDLSTSQFNYCLAIVLFFGLFGSEQIWAASEKNSAVAKTPKSTDSVKTKDNSEVKWLFRYRLEHVEQVGVPERALANTLLSRVTIAQSLTEKLSAGVEVDNVTVVGDSQYNDTVNGKTQFPTVADPRGTDLNQAFIQYQVREHQIKVGRQKIGLGNERFVGSVGWRQNEQTFDAVRYQTNLGDDWRFDYSLSNKVHRVFGSESAQGQWQSDLHLVDLHYKIAASSQFKFYFYSLDFQAAPLMSNQTIGVDYQHIGEFGLVQWQLFTALATQQEVGAQPMDFRANYKNIELQLTRGVFQAAFGYETLGSNNGVGFMTPLATLHKYQGFADKFLVTPSGGINDGQIKLGYKRKNWDVGVQYHWLSSAVGEINYGNELDLNVAYSFDDQYSVLLKMANYDAEQLATDTTKVWLQAIAKF